MDDRNQLQAPVLMDARAHQTVMSELYHPLQSIVAQLQFSKQDGELTRSQRSQMSGCSPPQRQSMASAGWIMEGLNSVLTYCMLASGGAELNPSEVHLPSVLREVVSSCEMMTNQRGEPLHCPDVRLVQAFSSDSGSIEADKNLVRLLLHHLLVNSLRFTTRGRVKVILAACEQGKGVEFSVEDTGSGIREADLPRIFRPWQQGEDVQGQPCQGVGIGLAICKEIVDRHGGSISCESIRGRGSKFTVKLPRRHLEALSPRGSEPVRLRQEPHIRIETPSFDHSQSIKGAIFALNSASGSEPHASRALQDSSCTLASASACSDSESERHGRPNVLSIDSEFTSQEALRLQLQAVIGRLVCCGSGDEAVAFLEEGSEKIDLIMVNLEAPGVDVLTTPRVQQRFRQIPIISLSHSISPADRVRASELGSGNVVQLPCRAKDIIIKVQERLSPLPQNPKVACPVPADNLDASTSWGAESTQRARAQVTTEAAWSRGAELQEQAKLPGMVQQQEERPQDEAMISQELYSRQHSRRKLKEDRSMRAMAKIQALQALQHTDWMDNLGRWQPHGTPGYACVSGAPQATLAGLAGVTAHLPPYCGFGGFVGTGCRYIGATRWW
mmetsp:Transcript_59639/g.134354  ORF Transcript_59639/g.134354 Transcript_59639/m.134354 type:complete len:614 (+) Transcript_59639:72-1913(+)